MSTITRDRELTREERARAAKAAQLTRHALNQGITVLDLVTEEGRQQALEGTRWDGASMATWQAVILNLAALEGLHAHV